MRNTAEFVRVTEDALGLSHKQAARIADDRSGETIVVVAKALSMPADVLQRILLLLNPAIGQSVQRVYDLAALHDEMTQDAALRLLAIWQESELHDLGSSRHRPMHWDDDIPDAAPHDAASRARGRKPSRRGRRSGPDGLAFALVWWFRNSLHSRRESVKGISEPKPH